MSQDQDQPDQPKKQDEATPDKASGSTKASEPKAEPQPVAVPAAVVQPLNNEELIIEQVRSELEQYFAPQNIQNDFNLRQKMTTDGYIDIDLLLDLKLMQDLVSNRDLLIEAISRSKLLVMNTGCTMVKYMPLLERNVLILRDIPTSTQKEEIMAIFANEHCATPAEIHSDIGNNWFCQFKTEDECVKTAKYLQQFGTYQKERLHVRVKAIHDKNKADTSPQMAPSPPIKPKIPSPQQAIPPPPQVAPYSPGYYQSAGYAYYGAQGPPNPMDAYYYGSPPQRPVAPPSAAKSGKRSAKKEAKAKSKGKSKEEETPDDTEDAEEADRTAISDYPGVFDKYSQQKFIDIYENMKDEALAIPQAMRGRDFRIISEEVLVPIALQPKKDKKESKKEKAVDEEDSKSKDKYKKKGKKKKSRKKREISGTYYEEEVYDEGGAYDEGYDYDAYDASAYYYEDPYNANGAYYYNYETQRAYGGGNGGGRREREKQYYDDDEGYYASNQRSKGRERERESGSGSNQQQPRRRARGSQYQPKQRSGARGYTSQRSGNARNKVSNPKKNKAKSGGAHWSPRQAKQYNTNKGVYRTKTTATSSSAY